MAGERGPTSEKYLHMAVMNAYEDIAVCIHSHAVYATMFAVAHQDVPSCIDEFTVYLGGDIRCTEYAPSGSPDLAEQVVKALDGRGAALIANHGMVAVGTTMEQAMHNTALVERSAKIIWGAKQLGGIFPVAREGQRAVRQLLHLHAVAGGGDALSDGTVRARLDELGLTLHGPHPPHDPLDAVVVHDGVARTSGQLPRIGGVLDRASVVSVTT